MAKNVETRIENRNRLAEMHMRKQGMFGRAVSGTGLAVANTWDRVTAPFKSDRSVFAGATAFGVARGAALGALVGILGIAIVATGPVTSAAAVAFFWASTAAGGAIAAVKDGQTKLERNWRRQNHQFADTIAEKTGAVPGPHQKMSGLNADIKHDILNPEKDSVMMKKAETLLKDDPSFAQRENRRRTNAPKVLHR